MCVLDYDFNVLNNAFLIHKPGIKRRKTPEEKKKTAGIVAKQNWRIKNRIGPEIKRIFGEREGCVMH